VVVASESLRGSLLIAMPQLLDPNFRRGVVLMLAHDDEGSFGLVLNRELDLSANRLCDSLDVRWCGDPRVSTHWGGPVEPASGWVLFDEDPVLADRPGEHTEVAPGLHFGDSLDVLKSVAEEPPHDARIYLGYAGWGGGQLEEELAQGAWLLAPLERRLVFDVPADRMWDTVLRGMGIDPASLIPTTGVH